ncbi:MAG: NAD(P)H-hydrate dehydratase, partial [Candidatus Ornithospirochaeta sp.]
SLKESSLMDKDMISRFSLSEEKLIGSAASGAFRKAYRQIKGRSVLFLVGKGNNGSDALEMARLSLDVASKVYVYVLFDNGNEENMRRRSILPQDVFVSEYVEADTIVDGVFGFSFRGVLSPELSSLFRKVDSSSSFRIALDVPSAFSYSADLTVTFMCLKSELYEAEKRGKCGEIFLYNPGFPEEGYGSSSTFLLSQDDYSVKSFSSSCYKNTRGHLLVAGGSARYPGAPLLSCLSAFHAGAGLVTLLSSPDVLSRVYSSYPSIMGIDKSLLPSLSYSAALAGPGWDKGEREVLHQLIENGKPMVVDADAIKLLSPSLPFEGEAVITPHLGEFRTLRNNLGIDERLSNVEAAEKISDQLSCVVVLKASTVWIVGDGKKYVYDGSNPSLGVAGSGDVLSGIIGAFLSSGLTAEEAAINGTILHQKCGRILRDKLGFYTSEDIIGEVGRER